MSAQSILRMQLENARQKLDKCCALASDMGNTTRHLERIWSLMAEANMLLQGADHSCYEIQESRQLQRG